MTQNVGAWTLPPRSISVISVQAPTKLNTKHIYQLTANDDLMVGIIPLAVYHKIEHKYPKLLSIPQLNTEHDPVHVPRKTIIRKLQPLEIEDTEVSNVLWTQDNINTTISPAELLSVIILLVFRKFLYTDLFDFLLTSVLTSTFPCNFFSPELSYPYMILPIPIPNH